MLSALFYGLYIIIVNKAKINVSGIKLSFYSMLFTSIYFLIKSLISKENLSIPSFSLVLNFVSFAFVTTLISSVTLVLAIQKIGSTPTAIMGALEPVVAVAVSVYFFNEAFTRNLLIGIVLILSGVSLNMLSSRKEV